MEEHSPVIFRIEDNIGVIEFDHPDQKVNVLNFAVMQRLDGILDEINLNKSLKALMIVSKKKDVFIAGADIKEIDGITQKEEGEKKAKAGQAVFNKLEDLKVPTVAVLDGVALGGGCELALACQYRVATFNEKVTIGLPEVRLGILPGFAGTYRLPKIVGLSQALKMILAGKTLSGPEAFKSGLIDRFFPQVGLYQSVIRFIREILESEGNQNFSHRPKKKFMQWFLDHTIIGQAMVFSTSQKNVDATTKGFYPAPPAALKVIRKTQGYSRASALEAEAEAFGSLVITPTSKNLVKLFYLNEKYKKYIPHGMENVASKGIEKCAILGAGVMGGGIAQLLSDKGVWVRMKDINLDALGKGLKAAGKIYKSEVERRRLKKHEAESRMARITTTLDYSGFQSSNMVIEAVVENMEVKKKVFRELSSVVGEETILCTNTSALSVRTMADETKDPSKVIGLHFFNPVNRMPLIEVIKTDITSRETIVTTLNFARRLGKTPILVKDSCGFLVNRILLSYINEAGRILEEGGSIEAVDKVMTDFGMPMGPFLLSDEVGLDVGLKVLHVLEAGCGEHFKPASIFAKVCENGLLGKKSGLGFYRHGQKRQPNEGIYKLLTAGPKGFESSENEMLRKRMVYIMVNEAGRCLEENVVEDAGAVDMGMIMGTGFPAFRGGLLNYADSIGAKNIVEELNQMADKLKTSRFKPCQYLLDLGRKSDTFYKHHS